MRPPFVCNEHYYPDAAVKTMTGRAVLALPVNVFTQAARMQQCPLNRAELVMRKSLAAVEKFAILKLEVESCF